MAIPDWSVPLLVSADVRQRLVEDRRAADAFFLIEYHRVRKVYRDTGSPRLGYLCGKGAADLGQELEARGSIGLGLLNTLLAEMLIACATSSTELDRAETHLIAARDQLEQSPHSHRATRVLGEWYMLLSVTHKARGKSSNYEATLDEGVGDRWLAEHGTAGDRIPIVRQQVMMRQDLDAHVALVLDAYRYKDERPLEYFRTLKRGVEFLANRGMASSTVRLKHDFMEAFGRVANRMSPISRISFAKNIAQIAALEGDRDEALRAAAAALSKAQATGLAGQARQLRILLTAIEGNDLRGALETFKVY